VLRFPPPPFFLVRIGNGILRQTFSFFFFFFFFFLFRLPRHLQKPRRVLFSLFPFLGSSEKGERSRGRPFLFFFFFLPSRRDGKARFRPPSLFPSFAVGGRSNGVFLFFFFFPLAGLEGSRGPVPFSFFFVWPQGRKGIGRVFFFFSFFGQARNSRALFSFFFLSSAQVRGQTGPEGSFPSFFFFFFSFLGKEMQPSPPSFFSGRHLGRGTRVGHFFFSSFSGDCHRDFFHQGGPRAREAFFFFSPRFLPGGHRAVSCLPFPLEFVYIRQGGRRAAVFFSFFFFFSPPSSATERKVSRAPPPLFFFSAFTTDQDGIPFFFSFFSFRTRYDRRKAASLFFSNPALPDKDTVLSLFFSLR